MTNDNPLTPQQLLHAYWHGYFPMADSANGPIHWYQPDPRAIIPLDQFHLPRSLRRFIRKNLFTIRTDTAFNQTIRACAAPRSYDHGETWINDKIIHAYTALHHLGFAHSVEAFLHEKLVGGIYGVSINAAFFGESMFTRPEIGGTNASKVTLAYLVAHLRKRGYTLFDTQFNNPHITQFGTTEIPNDDYLHRLAFAIRKTTVSWGNDFPAAPPIP